VNEKLIVIPTYDEKENVQPISRAIFHYLPDADILFVDDNSPDGTGKILDSMAERDKRINVLHNPGKSGLGRAYVKGFKWALERHYQYIFEMDADFSHDPAELPNFINAIKNADLVLGTRYAGGIRVTNWPLNRLLLSITAAKYVRLITGMPVTDPTGGYKCYRRAVLEEIGLDRIMSNGYSFQVETTFYTWIMGFKITEIPITFTERHAGYSKLERAILREALWIVWKLALANRFKRRGGKIHPRSIVSKNVGEHDSK
jgi:dolichol-phosphate mannosyltransferase